MENMDKNVSVIIDDFKDIIDIKVKEYIKYFIETLIKAEIDEYLEENTGIKNGYYERDINTKYGNIDDLRIPRERDNNFHTKLFPSYKRNIGIEDMIISMYSKGVSTRKIGKVIEEIYNYSLSRSSVSRITDIVKPGIDKWNNRRLNKRYIAIYIDALFINIRRDTVEKEAVIFALGARDDGYYEILGFYINPKETHYQYGEVLNDLYKRGVEESLLFITDGLKGIEEEIELIYPKSDFQLCTIHMTRYIKSRVRSSDRDKIVKDLNNIFFSNNKEEAIKGMDNFKDKHNEKYPEIIKTLYNHQGALLRYFDYPEPIRRSIKSTNIIERLNKETRRRTKIIDSFPSLESTEKILYLRSIEVNNEWSQRVMRGYFKCNYEIQEMFQRRYV